MRAFILVPFLLTLAAAAEKIEKVIYLNPGDNVFFEPVARHRGFFENDLRTYCYLGATKTLGRLFESIDLQLEIDGDDYTQYKGTNPAEVREHYDQQRSLFSFSLFAQKRTRLPLSPFAQQCIGIETLQSYRIRLQQQRVDFWRVIQMSVAVALFVYAAQLSYNSIFYYITGILLGICSSFMLLIWLTSKLMPRRPMMYGMLIGGWTIGIYIIQMLWENLQVIIVTYRIYVFWYILVTSVLSFFVCYRLGPPKNKRSKNIVKWLLQLIAMLLIYLSSHFEEATVAIILLTVVLTYFPRSLWYRTRAWYLRRFPPKPRLLTSEEYIEQGARETAKALDELRTYASSPECKSWKVMSKLRDPMRFAAFVEGASHLRDDEILRFESSHCQDDDSDDSDLSMDDDNNNGNDIDDDNDYSDEHAMMPRRDKRRAYSTQQRGQRRISVATRDDISEEDDDDDIEANDMNRNAIDVIENNYNHNASVRQRNNRSMAYDYNQSPAYAMPSNRSNTINRRHTPNYQRQSPASTSRTQLSTSTRLNNSSRKRSVDRDALERRQARTRRYDAGDGDYSD